MSKTALILGIGGQDGSYLAEHLLEQGYQVHGLYRRSSVDNLRRVRHLEARVTFHPGDLADEGSLRSILAACKPQEVYHLADQDDERWSYKVPDYNADITGAVVGRLLEAIRTGGRSKPRVLIPISAKVFDTTSWPQNEQTPLTPLSPYACAKAYALHLARYYRRVHDLFVATTILYNHDSPRRGPGYLLQTICRRAMEVAAGRFRLLEIGDPDAMVDVGFAGDYVQAMALALGAKSPTDYVIASGKPWMVKQWAQEALKQCGLGEAATTLVAVDPQYQGPVKRLNFIGDTTRARNQLGWAPQVSNQDLLRMILQGLKTPCV